MSARSTPKRSNRRVQSTTASRRQYVLDVKMRQSTARKVRRNRISGWVWASLFWIVLLVGSAVSIQTLLEKFFFKNPDYNIVEVKTELDGILTRDEALTQTGILPGKNIFSVNLGAATKTLLRIPEVRSATVERELPATIRIQLEAREPTAWISPSKGADSDPGNLGDCLLVDSKGFVYKPWQVRAEHSMLPVIYGISPEALSSDEPQSRQELKAALKLLATNQANPKSLLLIRSMDLSKGYCIEVINDRNSHFIFSTEDFENQLERLNKLMVYSAENTREIESANLIPIRNTPVRFVMAAAVEPAPKASKKR